jgi:hypothetical protein
MKSTSYLKAMLDREGPAQTSCVPLHSVLLQGCGLHAERQAACFEVTLREWERRIGIELSHRVCLVMQHCPGST